MRWPVAALIAQGHDVGILEPEHRGVRAVLSGGHVISATFPECDVLVLQRPTSQRLVECIPFMQARGSAICIDFDDDLSNINPNNPAFAGMHPRRDATNHWRWAEQAARLADLVTVSTPALAKKYGGHGRVRVLRNCVPDHYLDVTPAERWGGFGWAGALHSHPGDLQTLGAAAAKLTQAGHEFQVVGPADGIGRVLGLSQDPQGTGLVPFNAWPHYVARLSVGIAPLNPTVFGESKSWWKPLEYAALGVPSVSGPTSEYRRLGALGATVIAEKPRDWLRELGALLASEDLRAERAGKARAVAESLRYSLHACEWAEAWSDALANRRARPLVAR